MENDAIRVQAEDMEVIDTDESYESTFSTNKFVVPALIVGAAVVGGIVLYKKVLRPAGKAVVAGAKTAKETFEQERANPEEEF